jgi:hypothetical protein
MDAKEREKLYKVISKHGNTTRRELLKDMGWDREKLGYYLDLLYWEGLIDLNGRRQRGVSIIEKDRINETFLERHIDTPYLFYNVDKEKVHSLLKEKTAKSKTRKTKKK